MSAPASCRLARSKARSLYSIVVLALATGARKNELLTLTWSDVDLKNGLLTFEKTKSGRHRAVPVTGQALAVLRAIPRRLDTTLLFPGHRDKSQPLEIQNIFKAAVKRAEIEDLHFHDLRHSCASYLVAAGVHMRVVQEILGHHSVTVTEKYAHVSKEHLRDAVHRAGVRIFGG